MIFSTTQFRGIIPPMVTPLKDDVQLDHTGLERLVEHILAGGVHGLFVLGTTGEGPSLPYSTRRELVRATCTLVRGRVPVLVGITDTVPEESLALAKFSAEAGASAVVLAPPFYFPMHQEELWSYINATARQLPLPFFLYNIPSLTKVTVSEDVARRTLALPNCLGMKDSSGDLLYFKRLQRLLAEVPTRSLFMGPEELLVESLLAGGNGGVSGGANVWPRLYVDIYEKAMQGDWAAACQAQAKVLTISRRIYSVGGYGATVIKTIKGALEIIAVCNSGVASPQLKLTDGDLANLRRAMGDLEFAV